MSHAPGPRAAFVSFVLPCHVSTAEQLTRLDETLQTLAAHARDHEVIVVDNGSPMDVTPVAAASRQVFLVRQPHAGRAMALNAGIDVARGGVFAFLEPGDRLRSGGVDDGLAALASHPACGFVMGPRPTGSPLEGAAAAGVSPVDEPRLYLPLLRGDWHLAPSSSALVRREVVETLGGFRDPSGADDLDFYLRAAWMFEAAALPAPPLTCQPPRVVRPLADIELVVESIRAVYERQWPLVHGHPDGEAAWHTGLQRLTERCLGLSERAPAAADLLADGSTRPRALLEAAGRPRVAGWTAAGPRPVG